jgi:hypothetical protein
MLDAPDGRQNAQSPRLRKQCPSRVGAIHVAHFQLTAVVIMAAVGRLAIIAPQRAPAPHDRATTAPR